MSISLSWAIALGVAGVMGVVLCLSIAARHGLVAIPERSLVHVAYLLGGGIAGFTAIAFPPAWPLLAAVVGMLVIRATKRTQGLDVGLLAVGFGLTWTCLASYAILNEINDPAVHSVGDSRGWFAVGAAVLVFGLVVTIGSSAIRQPPRHPR